MSRHLFDRPHSVYRCFSASGELLYVGCAINTIKRAHEHECSSSWFAEVARIDVAHFTNRRDALGAERDAIASERPKYNVHFQPVEDLPRARAAKAESIRAGQARQAERERARLAALASRRVEPVGGESR